MLAVLPQITRRNVNKSGLEWTGLALAVFNLFVLLLAFLSAVVGLTGRDLPSLAFAPRYFFSARFSGPDCC